MKLGWYIARLRSMGPAEFLHRLEEKRRKIVSRGRDEGWTRHRALPLRTVFRPFAAILRTAPPDAKASIATAAGHIMSGRFSALGRDWPVRDPADLFPHDLWRLDPVTGNLWPGEDTYAFDIDFRPDGRLGDIKYVWEINRLQFLPLLAAQLVLTNDKGCRRAIKAAISSWHAANPPFRGVGWASGIEVALRAISLIVTLDRVGEQLGDDIRRKTAEILSASAYWLERFPSLHSSANNHRIAELAGSLLIGLAQAADVARTRSALETEALRQIFSDGAPAEQSPTYGAFTAEMILISAIAGRLTGEILSKEVENRLFAFADFVSWIGPCTRFGDDDEGQVLTSLSPVDYPTSIAAEIADLPNDRRRGPVAIRAAMHGLPSIDSEHPTGLKTYADGGLSIWRGDIAGRHVELLFDHGPLGYLAIAAHGHADALSLTLDIDGRPVLIDPGTYLYGSGGIWRDWFRSTPAHNTLNIAGESQSVMSGKFNWSHKATTTLVASDPPPDWSLRARHDGYRGRFGVVHERMVAQLADGIGVTDRLLGGTHMSEIVFQLAPELATRHEGAAVTIYENDRPLLKIMFPSDAVTIFRGGENPRDGWVSPRFGTKVPADRIVWRGKVDENGVLSRLLPLRHLV